jgi:hypothetical protein
MPSTSLKTMCFGIKILDGDSAAAKEDKRKMQAEIRLRMIVSFATAEEVGGSV